MMRMSDLEKFSNLFLFLEGDQPVVRSYGHLDRERAKRPHTKSRNGCLACKRRRVKCDERLPCGHCVNRREKCERPDPRPTTPKVEIPQQPPDLAHHVNTLHIELFHHFDKSTRFTFSFQEIWETQLRESFKHEYLMHAMLAVSAKHMSVQRPQDPRYAEAAIVLLNKSIHSFRETLNTPITADNCEARLGTSVLINYMAWTELGFLDGQRIVADPGGSGLDMSKDLLFLLGSGIRQVFFTAFPIFHEHDSPFIKVGKYHPCDHLQAEAEERGAPWQDIMQRLLNLFDDPRYQGNPTKGISPPSHHGSSPDLHSSTSPSAAANDLDMNLDIDPGPPGSPSPEPHSASPTSASPAATNNTPGWQWTCSKEFATYDEHYLQRVIALTNDHARAARFSMEGLTARTLYERISQRLSVLLSFIPEDDSGAETVPLSEARHMDIERFFFSFPTLCFGPFMKLILENDSRALVIMYHTYRAANRLLRYEKTWWAAERAAKMEALTLAELKARGLGGGI